MRLVLFFFWLCVGLGFFFRLIVHFPQVSFFVYKTIRAMENVCTVTAESSQPG